MSALTITVGLTFAALVIVIANRGRGLRGRSAERGEGVVSVAIAVLIMAVLGAILFTAFKATTENAGKRTDDIVNGIK